MKWLATTLTSASLLAASHSLAATYADAVADYQPGSGAAAGFDAPAAALGAPATVNSDPVWGGPVTPFNAPYQPEQLVSVGAGGHLTVRFDRPILNDPANPFGLDFVIYGNSMFVDSDWPNGKTDSSGATFGENSGPTEVWVSANGANYFRLNPSLAPVVDGLYPTDGQGILGQPVNPALNRGDFANRTLAQIRALYAGAAGGCGYDLAWAQDGSGAAVHLPEVSFVRVEVLGGTSEVDAFAVVPEPAAWLLVVLGGGVLCLIRRRNT